MVVNPNELYHYGILGMKWGVRRYQNPDGSLTAAGARRYSQMDPDKMHKELSKQIDRQRSKYNGGVNKGKALTAIGEYSKKELRENAKREKAFKSTSDYKKWNTYEKKRFEMFLNPNTTQKDFDDYVWNKAPKTPKPSADNSYVSRETLNLSTKMGRNACKPYKDLSVAYLRDLGYNEAAARQMVDRLAKHSLTLAR